MRPMPKRTMQWWQTGFRQELERKITTSPIVKMLRENLFVNVNGSDTAGGLSLSLLEFAFKVKGNEEASRDRDDAEKILKVGFDTLVTICRQPVGLGKDTEFAQVYLWQLYKFADALMGDEDVVKMGKNGFEYVQRLFNWANEHGCFYDLDPLNHPLSFTVKRPADPVVDEGTVTE